MAEDQDQPDAGSEEEAPSTPDAPEPERDDAPAEQDAPPGADAPQPGQENPHADEGAEAAAEPAEAEAQAAEPAEAEAEPAESTEPAEAEADEPPARKQAPPAAEKGEVVPGADLDPIAITEERELSAEERAALEAEAEERARREAEAAADDEEELPARKAAAVPADASVQATGKRKSSVARVLLRAGDGKLEVNGRSVEDYFPRPQHQSMARQPLVTSGYDGSVDIRVRVHGGGISGQAGAIRHGIARALVELEPELRGDLKRRGLLTRDAREKERRKAGLKKARKRPQFSKR